MQLVSMCGNIFRLSLLLLLLGQCSAVEGAQVQQATDNSLFYLGMITGVAACVAVLVFGGVIMRKIHLRTQLQVSGNVKEEEQRDIEPYSTFTRKTNGLYSTLQLLNP
ncbi:uncharacterized protein LOC116359750 isoform X3 [Oncorhynchus kisutch]|uniref:uncharacterized protein LOC116359750 isoform X3 n=1 Tax=Oncorhynchus kisutch TaxID=8019 RepID=UPI0012DCAEC0|nr:uncharacterized protein LOC116359750 isoform X3 [Oncorhynchus kisutch]